MQKYWSGTVTRNTVMRRAADYLDLIKPNIAALDYTAAVRTCGALNLQIHTSFSSGPNRNVTTVCRKITFFWGLCRNINYSDRYSPLPSVPILIHTSEIGTDAVIPHIRSYSHLGRSAAGQSPAEPR